MQGPSGAVLGSLAAAILIAAAGVSSVSAAETDLTTVPPAALPSKLSNWLGVSRGHWEGGNTLVIETDQLNTTPSATHAGAWGSPRNNHARLDWKRNEKYVLYEHACHEADVQISGLITSRAERAQKAKTVAAFSPQPRPQLDGQQDNGETT